MSTVVLAARIALSVVFLVAAAGKFIDLRGSRASLVGFGLPERAANVLGTVLPVAELAVAVALIPQPSAQWGAVGGRSCCSGSSAASRARWRGAKRRTAPASARSTRRR